MRPQSKPRKTLLALLALATLGFSSSASTAAVIYQHNFGGSPENTLNGVALDTSSSAFGGTAGATWLTNPSRYFADGTLTSTTNSASAYVPFSPVNGYQYTISLGIDITSEQSTNWIALSLLNGTPNEDGGGNFTTVTTTYATIGRRHSTVSGNNGTDLLRWEGPGTGGGHHIDEPITGTWNVSILLDTTNPDNWTFRWLMQGDNNVEHLSDPYNLGTTSLSHIMISNNANVSGTLSDFSVTAVPEPGLTLLSSLGACLLTLRRTRRKTPCRGGL